MISLLVITYNNINMACMFVIFAVLVVVKARSSTEAPHKDQYCIDPRTMLKHPAYSEWADAYSCTRHRCQPGGRHLAIYTVGCKRVEAPESAIECEEVVEDTNVQFPYCCTRLRCLVVVRGEVWTRVLGQPWETLPAAPWSHMYKRKRPPPVPDTAFLPNQGEGPVYELIELSQAAGKSKLRRSNGGETAGCSEARARSDGPDIVIALSTDEQPKELKNNKMAHRSRSKSKSHLKKEEPRLDEEEAYIEDFLEKAIEQQAPATETLSEKRRFQKKSDDTHSKPSRNQPKIPWNQWKETDPPESAKQSQEYSSEQPAEKRKDESGELPSTDLHALVQAIGKRMRDIEDVVQRMSETVHKVESPATDREVETASEEKTGSVVYGAYDSDLDVRNDETKKHSPDEKDSYKRFLPQRGNAGSTTEPLLFIEDSNGYYSDASNTILRREPKEPHPDTYITPADNLSKPHNLNKQPPAADSAEKEKSGKKVHKKRMHKKKHLKGHHKKHLAKNEKLRKVSVSSKELETDAMSIEGVSITTKKSNNY